jgi:hypothetical protein
LGRPARELDRREHAAGDARILALALHLASPETVYAGTRMQGVFKTMDEGASWRV